MRKVTSTLIGLAAMFSICSCSESIGAVKELRDPEAPSVALDANVIKNEGYKDFKAKIKAFSAKVSEEFCDYYLEKDSNIACSPISIEMCLGLAIPCANGATRQELLDAIGVDFDTFNQYYGLLYKELYRDSRNQSGEVLAQLFLTNSIWINNGAKVLDNGLDALRDNYYCYSYKTDFGTKESNKAIADFIDEKTNHLIKPSIDFSPDTLFVLMNTLYLKDLWLEGGLDLSINNEAKFTNSNGTTSQKKLVKGRYFPGKAKAEETYSSFYTSTQKGVTLTFIKPNQGKTAKEVFTQSVIESALDITSYVGADEEKKEYYYTACTFPEFEASCDQEISLLIQNEFGVKSLFGSSCDFSNLTETPTHCDEIRHITKLNVDKKGIEGAAVTYMAVSGSAGPNPYYTSVYEDYIVDREFGFVVSYQDAVLFSGIINSID